MKSKALYIGSKIVKPSSGADQVNRRNQLLLESLCEVSYLPFKGGLFPKLFLCCTNKYLNTVDTKMEDVDFEYVFIQQSLYGRVCCHIKKRYPKVKIIVFFHNIEIQYATEYMKTNVLKALPFYFVVKYWEKYCCQYADFCITLNSRDSRLLKNIYGRNADLELPTSFPDLYNAEKANCELDDKLSPVIDYLFVGVSFFANVEAVQWFIDNVMPNIDGHFYVMGKGMDRIAFKNVTERVHIYGYVDDLSSYYYRAKYVVSPIHVGGGMKTKTAEALMYGKTILGSKEAFEGYEVDNRCMILCENAEDYINNVVNGNCRINEYSRAIFKRKYCDSIIMKKFQNFIISISSYK